MERSFTPRHSNQGEMTEEGHELQILSMKYFHTYELKEQELEELLLREEIRDLPVVVVSVAGAYRGGKSFLLNFFLRYLSSPPSDREDGSWLGEDSEPLAGFRWRSGSKATTMGILMWSEPFITTLPSGEKVAILLVDTQGNFDSRSTVRDNSTIFAFSTLISSIQIYNISQNIREDDLQHLVLFTEYGKLVNANDSNAKAFQVLEFLVRDWQFPEEYPYGRVGGRRLLQEKFGITPDLGKEMRELRQNIRASFEKVSCFLMPHPGISVLRSTFTGSISDINLEFRNYLKNLVNFIFGPEKLKPKTIYGERVKARNLFNYFKTYMELFNSDQIPTPINILAMTVKAGLLSAVNEARDIYVKGMDAECGPKQLFVPPVDLKFLHEKYMEKATKIFTNKKKMGSKEEAAKYLKDLNKDLVHQLPLFLQSNLSKIQTAIKKANDAFDEVTKKNSMDRLCWHTLDIEPLYNNGVDAATRIYDAAVKRVTQQEDEERAKFIKSYEKQKDDLIKTNRQSNNQIVTELRMEYWQHMQAKAALEPPLSDLEFKTEDANAKKKAVENFYLKRNKPYNNYTEDVYRYFLEKSLNDSYTQLKVINNSKNKKAMTKGIEAYNNYVKEHWDNPAQCLHPSQLEKLGQLATCRSLQAFHPLLHETCPAGFIDNDNDESTLKTILSQRYEELEKTNNDANDNAVQRSYRKYIDTMDDKCRLSMSWILIIPYLINKTSRNSFHADAKEEAFNLFDHARLTINFDDEDVNTPDKEVSVKPDKYRKRLEELMWESYTLSYK